MHELCRRDNITRIGAVTAQHTQFGTFGATDEIPRLAFIADATALDALDDDGVMLIEAGDVLAEEGGKHAADDGWHVRIQGI